MSLHQLLFECWYANHPLRFLLLPVSYLFALLASLRRLAYKSGLLRRHRLGVPVIVVGNISVGGTGKTPLVIWLVEFLRAQGLKPGVIIRGYGGHAETWPQQVRADSDTFMVGDEAVLLAQRCDCPVAAGPDRVASGEALIRHHQCDVIISDDGLQHYRLQRDIEIVVIDGERRHGNGHCLPAGPLREPVRRLAEADMLVSNGMAARGEFIMNTLSGQLHPPDSPDKSIPAHALQGQTVHGVAAIGHPQRFFSTLKGKGMQVIAHPFPDHYPLTASDISFGDDLPVVMTEKDAVKCRGFSLPNLWYLPIEAELPQTFAHRLMQLLGKIKAQSHLEDHYG